MRLTPVATVFNGVKETPKGDWRRIRSRLVFKEEYAKGLYRVRECSRIWVIFGFHRVRGSQSLVRPRKAKDKSKIGIFASRGIQRPNHLGLTLVHLIKASRNTLIVTGLDAFDGSPVYDIKPYDSDYDQ